MYDSFNRLGKVLRLNVCGVVLHGVLRGVVLHGGGPQESTGRGVAWWVAGDGLDAGCIPMIKDD